MATKTQEALSEINELFSQVQGGAISPEQLQEKYDQVVTRVEGLRPKSSGGGGGTPWSAMTEEQKEVRRAYNRGRREKMTDEQKAAQKAAGVARRVAIMADPEKAAELKAKQKTYREKRTTELAEMKAKLEELKALTESQGKPSRQQGR